MISNKLSPPVRLIFILVFAILISEFIIMHFLHAWPHLSDTLEAVIDASLLVAMIFPILFFCEFLPLKRQIKRDQQRIYENKLLSEMSDFIQTCTKSEDAYDIIAQTAQQIFPETTFGALFIYSASRTDLEAMRAWGSQTLHQDESMFSPDDCWALKLGRMYSADDSLIKITCKHMASGQCNSFLCIPLIAHGEVLGVLQLRPNPVKTGSGKTAALVSSLAEHAALTLSNLRLREKLKTQSIHDPLTGLYNRRYLEETLEREIHRTVRKQETLGVVMLDMDHFKDFNDKFGHNAGNALLCEFGSLMKRTFRAEDIACRYGGDEFTLIIPEASLETILSRLETFRFNVSQMRVAYLDQILGDVTTSMGVAMFPNHGSNAQALLEAADRALYQAKNAGRDQIVVVDSVMTAISANELNHAMTVYP